MHLQLDLQGLTGQWQPNLTHRGRKSRHQSANVTVRAGALSRVELTSANDPYLLKIVIDSVFGKAIVLKVPRPVSPVPAMLNEKIGYCSALNSVISERPHTHLAPPKPF